MAQRSSRKRRKQRRREQRESKPPADGMARGYARGREKDEAARAALKPLKEGERPTAVTVAALLAAGLAIAELVSFGLGYEAGEEGKVVRSVVVITLLSVMAWGMWHARYWAVLGMQTLLALTLIGASIGALGAKNRDAVILVVAIAVPAGVMFWFLVKAMARIQMPERPGS